MSDTDTYDTRVQAIRDSNQPILDSFQAWLEQSGLTDKTIKSYLSHIRLFAEYLVYYDDPLKKLDQAHSGDVRTFLSYWFPRKVMYDSVPSPKSYMASLKKFFQWMGETGRVSPKTVAGVLTMLKAGRDEFLESAADYNSYPWFTQ